MTVTQQKAAAKDFAEYWKGKGYEKGESQKFWLSLLRDVYGVEHPERFISFEDKVHLDHTSFIDGMIPTTRVLIEQKSLNMVLSILVDTFSQRISQTMPSTSKSHNIVCVLAWEEGRHWQSRFSDYSNS